MTSDVRELYQAVILDHHKHPRNFRALEGGRHAEGCNPLCGDRVTVYVRVEDGVITDATFQGSGCAVSKASASLMTDSVTGKTVAESEALSERFHRLITAPPDASIEDLGTLSVFAGVRRFPARIKCASLAWHTFRAAVELGDQVVSTE